MSSPVKVDEEMNVEEDDDTEDDQPNSNNNIEKDSTNTHGNQNADDSQCVDGKEGKNTSDKDNAEGKSKEKVDEEASKKEDNEEANDKEANDEGANKEADEEANVTAGGANDFIAETGVEIMPSAQSGLGGNATAQRSEPSDRQGQNQGMTSTNGCDDTGSSAEHRTPVLAGPAERRARGIPRVGVELTDQSEHQSDSLVEDFRRSLIVARQALHDLICGPSITDRMLLEMFQSPDLSTKLKCASPSDEMNRAEGGQHSEVAGSTTQSTKRKLVDHIDLTRDDDADIDVNIMSGRKKPRTPPRRRMADGIPITRNKKLP